jgi:NADPH-dependent F420 reductase
LARRLALTGAHVTIGSRHTDRALDIAARLREGHPTADIAGASNRDTVSDADVIILTLPFVHLAATLQAQRDAFRPGTLVIDVTVPVFFEGGRPRFIEPPDGSAAEHVRQLLPDHVAVAGAFKTLPAALLEKAADPLDCDEFVCGDSKESRERAMGIVGRIPTLRPLDAGSLDAARTIERMTLLAITLNRRYKSHASRFHVLGV